MSVCASTEAMDISPGLKKAIDGTKRRLTIASRRFEEKNRSILDAAGREGKKGANPFVF